MSAGELVIQTGRAESDRFKFTGDYLAVEIAGFVNIAARGVEQLRIEAEPPPPPEPEPEPVDPEADLRIPEWIKHNRWRVA